MARHDPEPRASIYERITATIIGSLEQGVRPWIKPWASGPATRPLRHTGEPYAGINILILWAEAEARGYTSPTWMTFRQATALGAHVRRGERGTTVVYADTLRRTETADDGSAEELERQIPFLKTYTVFSVEQIEGLPERYLVQTPDPLPIEQRIAHADAFFARIGADVRHGGGEAYYALASDHVQMPPFERFRDAESYYATLAHEHSHWTRHASRLARDLGGRSFGDQGYAREELVAELAAAYLCADLGVTATPREDHAAYIASWLEVLRADSRAIFAAAAHASRAVAYLHAAATPP